MGENVIAWTDVETTGLDPHQEQLLEVACIVTDLQGNVLDEAFHEVIGYSAFEVDTMRESAVEVVREMHHLTGLWDRLESGRPLSEVEMDLLSYIKVHAPEPRQAEVGGNSVRLDLNFMDRHMPTVAAHLHYRTTDVTVLRRMLERAGITVSRVENPQQHSALSDIRTAILEYQLLMDALGGVPETRRKNDMLTLKLDRVRETLQLRTEALARVVRENERLRGERG